MSTKVIGVGEVGVTKDAGAVLKTFALGSCVAVILLDPTQRAIGMAHIALPRSKTNPERAKETPAYFADTGLDLLFERMAGLGCDPSGKGMVVKLVGGAKVLAMDSSFEIGKKNALAIKKHLWKRGLGPLSEDLGGNKSRTVVLEQGTGCVTISSSTGESWEI